MSEGPAPPGLKPVVDAAAAAREARGQGIGWGGGCAIAGGVMLLFTFIGPHPEEYTAARVFWTIFTAAALAVAAGFAYKLCSARRCLSVALRAFVDTGSAEALRPFAADLVFASAVAALQCRRLGGRAGIPSLPEVLGFLRERRANVQGQHVDAVLHILGD